MQTITSTSENKENNLPLRLWTVTEYHRMGELGILLPQESVELIAGQIIKKMSPQGTPHATAIRLLMHLFDRLLGNRVLIQTQLPITLNNYSEPEPDIALVIPDILRYLKHHPTPTEIYLIIEIADTTLKTDSELKALEYAKAGIKDYLVLDLNNRKLRVFRTPTPQGYQEKIILNETDSISPLEFPDITLLVKEMLPPILP